jgi:hypothetical protein
MNVSLHENVLRMLTEGLPVNRAVSANDLNSALRLLAKWRSVLVQNTLLRESGTIVGQGPFQGLDFLEQSSEGCHIPKLLGCYEQPIHEFIRAAVSQDYDAILNIGCAEGYYAVGFARLMPTAHVYAFDTNQAAQKACRLLAEKNAVGGRVQIGGLFDHEDFKKFSTQRTLVFCDIEGAEADLLDPSIAPALTEMDIIVESHEGMRPGLTAALRQRFVASHDITLVEDNGHRALADMPAWFLGLGHLDQLLATWEWRSGPTPWLVMRARGRM